jgi:DNA-3-methyladenine glycosylase II
MTHIANLNLESLNQAVKTLCTIDPRLAELYARLGLPPLWAHEPGFPTLVHIILEQQVSLASARAAFDKLQEACGTFITPGRFLKLDDATLKRIGFSRQKTTYCRGLAMTILNGELNLEELPSLDDASARNALTRIKGIGPWTADIYLLMVLLRPDTWPSGDLALAISMQEIQELPTRPNAAQMKEIAQVWQPWRAVAARMLWFSYLRKRGLA